MKAKKPAKATKKVAKKTVKKTVKTVRKAPFDVRGRLASIRSAWAQLGREIDKLIESA